VNKVLVDTGAWYALVDRKDPDYVDVRACLNAYQGRLVVSDYILDETLTLLRYRLGWEAANTFGESLLSGDVAALHDLTRKDKEEAWRIFRQYRDKSFSFTDCTSFALMQRLKLTTAVAIDSDFRTYGLHCIP